VHVSPEKSTAYWLDAPCSGHRARYGAIRISNARDDVEKLVPHSASFSHGEHAAEARAVDCVYATAACCGEENDAVWGFSRHPSDFTPLPAAEILARRQIVLPAAPSPVPIAPRRKEGVDGDLPLGHALRRAAAHSSHRRFLRYRLVPGREPVGRSGSAGGTSAPTRAWVMGRVSACQQRHERRDGRIRPIPPFAPASRRPASHRRRPPPAPRQIGNRLVLEAVRVTAASRIQVVTYDRREMTQRRHCSRNCAATAGCSRICRARSGVSGVFLLNTASESPPCR